MAGSSKVPGEVETALLGKIRPSASLSRLRAERTSPSIPRGQLNSHIGNGSSQNWKVQAGPCSTRWPGRGDRVRFRRGSQRDIIRLRTILDDQASARPRRQLPGYPVQSRGLWRRPLHRQDPDPSVVAGPGEEVGDE